MTNSPAWSLQTAIFDALTQASAIQALIGNPARIYDAVPSEAIFPLLQLGAARIVLLKGVEDAHEHIISINAFSRWGGRRECKLLAQAVRDVLQNARFDLGTHEVVQARMVFEDLLKVRDPETFQAAIRYRFVVMPQAVPV